MKGKTMWALVACATTLSLLMASCATPGNTAPTTTAPTASAATTTAPTTPATTGKETVKDSLGRLVEKPVYGGTFVRSVSASPQVWDETLYRSGFTWPCVYTNESVLIGDWAKGPTGSGQAGWRNFIWPPPSIMSGCLAESWEIKDDQTIIFHIRKGVHFALSTTSEASKLVNGREVNADDIAYSIMRAATTPTSYHYASQPLGKVLQSVTAPDKWTVVFKVCPGTMYLGYYGYLILGTAIVPREAVEKYGNLGDWRNNCGTGPFILTDFVSDSSISYVRNRNYWGTDPLHPENTLPYADNLKILIIADRSTQIAAFRTGKIDQMGNLLLDEQQDLKKTNPDMHFARMLPSTVGITWRVDQKPFNDVRVRRALWMAVDSQAIAKDYYRGDAEMQTMGCLPIPDLMDYYTPIKDLPESTKELFTYNPEKAKALLAEAGYPNGFKTHILCVQQDVDLVSIIASSYKAVGVDLDIQVREPGVLGTIMNNKTYMQMVVSGRSAERPEALTMYTAGQAANHCMVDDPKINQAYIDSAATAITNRAANVKLVKDILVYILDQAYTYEQPKPYYYLGWQPWVKSYNGELNVGGRGHADNYPKFVWIDQELKRSMRY